MKLKTCVDSFTCFPLLLKTEKSTSRLAIHVSPKAPFPRQELAETIKASRIEIEKRNPYKTFPENFLDGSMVLLTTVFFGKNMQ